MKTNVAERLKASKAHLDAESSEKGVNRGAEWAERFGNASNLNSSRSLNSKIIAKEFDGDLDNMVALNSPEFAAGFVDGAVAVYEEHT